MGSYLIRSEHFSDSISIVGGGATPTTVQRQFSVPLPRDCDLKFIVLYLKGTINVTTAATSVFKEGVARLLKNVTLSAGGQQDYQLSGVIANGCMQGQGFHTVRKSPLAAVGSYQVEAKFIVPFSYMLGLNTKDSQLQCANFENLQLMMQFGVWSDVFAGGAGDMQLSIKMGLERSVEEGDGNIRYAVPLMAVRRVYKTTVSAANSALKMLLEPNLKVAQIILRPTVAGELSEAVINRVTVRACDSRGVSRERYNYTKDFAFDVGAEAYPGIAGSDSANLNAVAIDPAYQIVDFCKTVGYGYGYLSDAVNTAYGDAELILDVSCPNPASTEVEIHVVAYRDIVEAQALNALIDRGM